MLTYCFFDLTKLFKLLTQSSLLGVPCQATGVGVSQLAGYLSVGDAAMETNPMKSFAIAATRKARAQKEWGDWTGMRSSTRYCAETETPSKTEKRADYGEEGEIWQVGLSKRVVSYFTGRVSSKSTWGA